MRALQYEGRLIEWVAYMLDSIGRDAPESPLTGPVKKVLLTGRDTDFAQLALARLAQEFRKPPDLDGLARELGTNPNKLRAAFKGAFGVTMAEYCLERRIREAQQLLLEGRLSIAQVSERVGYEYPSGLAAAFTAHVGMTPRVYRQQRAPISLPLRSPGLSAGVLLGE